MRLTRDPWQIFESISANMINLRHTQKELQVLRQDREVLSDKIEQLEKDEQDYLAFLKELEKCICTGDQDA